MTTLKIKFIFRRFGNISLSNEVMLVCVEPDSTESEIHKQIMWYYYRYIDNKNIVEKHPYKILKNC